MKAPKFSSIGKTVVTKTAGQRQAKDNLIGRVFESSLGDLRKGTGDDDSYRKLRFRVEDVQGSLALTNFYGMDLTTDKLRSLVRKWTTLIETHVDVKTADGYLLRVFAIGFTSKRKMQKRKTSYAQSAQVRQIRKKMVEIITRETAVDLSELVTKFVSEVIGREIEKAAQGIYPLQNVMIRKVKMLRSPKADIGKLLELHGGSELVQREGAAPTVTIGRAVDAAAEKPVKKGKGGKKEKDEEEEPSAGKDKEEDAGDD